MKEKHFVLDKNFCPDISQMKELYYHLFSLGKQIRANLTMLTAKYLNISKKQSRELAGIIEYIHHSSILHDDVIDSSPTRRGGLSSWVQFSMKKSILAGDYLMAEAAKKTAEMNNIYLMKLTAQTIQKLVKGEWMQNTFKSKETENNIQNIHELKTASLFQWCLRAPFLTAGRYQEGLHSLLDHIGLYLGILFQRADDLLDFDIRNQENKQTFKDLEEGFLNSFSVWLLKNKNKKTELKNCRSLKEVKSLFGHSEFEKCLLSFDKNNSSLIRKCRQKTADLSSWLKPEEKSFITALAPWPKNLYWRTHA